VDTNTFDSHSPEVYKEHTRQHWSKAPCGSGYAAAAFGTKEFFDQIEAHRYRTHPWIKQAIDLFDIGGKEVLEIGFGMGTDHLSLARRGARMHGIDLTPRSREITDQRLALYGFRSDLRTGDAEALPYADSSVDFVYSFGVIHHSPDTAKIVAEIHRVLKPGGCCWITVYHKNSIFFWWSVFCCDHILRGGWRKRTIQQRLSLIESPGTRDDLVIRLFARNEFRALFRQFSHTRSSVRHLLPLDIAFFGRLWKIPDGPTPFLDSLGRRGGWYVIVDAVK
jgi:ubiquinone/menaquinone biosynthesis C-methylase UbiE